MTNKSFGDHHNNSVDRTRENGLAVLVISPIPSHPQDSGNRARLHSLLSALKEQGIAVHLLYVEKFLGADFLSMTACWKSVYRVPYKTKNPWKNLARHLVNQIDKIIPGFFGKLDSAISRFRIQPTPKPRKVDDWYPINLDSEIQALIKKFSVSAVIIEYAYLSKAFNNFGNKVLKILDTHDVFSDRDKKFLSAGKNPVSFYTTPSEESIALDRADIVLAIQNRDRSFFEKLCKKTVITIGHIPKNLTTQEDNLADSDPRRLLYIATNIAPNQDAIDYFLTHIWPQLRNIHPTLELDVIGNICSHLSERQAPGVCLHNRVASLEDFYNTNAIVVNPVRIGTGLKIKNMEALFFGKPLVTTSTGAQGLEEWANKAFIVADTPEDICSSLSNLVTDDDAYSLLAQAAIEFSKCYTIDFQNNLSELCRRIMKNHAALALQTNKEDD